MVSFLDHQYLETHETPLAKYHHKLTVRGFATGEYEGA
jgi:hypothetical protein